METALYKARKYNELLGKWFKGSEWLQDVNRTKDEKERGFIVLQKRLISLSKVYNELKTLGVEVKAEEYIDLKIIEVAPPF